MRNSDEDHVVVASASTLAFRRNESEARSTGSADDSAPEAVAPAGARTDVLSMPWSEPDSASSFEAPTTDVRPVIATSRRQLERLHVWDRLLGEYAAALRRGDTNAVYRFAFFDCYKPFIDDDTMLSAADALLVRAKSVILDNPSAEYRRELADKVDVLREVFRSGATENTVLDWMAALPVLG